MADQTLMQLLFGGGDKVAPAGTLSGTITGQKPQPSWWDDLKSRVDEISPSTIARKIGSEAYSHYTRGDLGSYASSAVDALGNGALMGYGPEIRGNLRHALFGEDASAETDATRAQLGQFQQDNPYTSGAAGVGGGIAAFANPVTSAIAGGTLARGATDSWGDALGAGDDDPNRAGKFIDAGVRTGFAGLAALPVVGQAARRAGPATADLASLLMSGSKVGAGTATAAGIGGGGYLAATGPAHAADTDGTDTPGSSWSKTINDIANYGLVRNPPTPRKAQSRDEYIQAHVPGQMQIGDTRYKEIYDKRYKDYLADPSNRGRTVQAAREAKNTAADAMVADKIRYDDAIASVGKGDDSGDFATYVKSLSDQDSADAKAYNSMDFYQRNPVAGLAMPAAVALAGLKGFSKARNLGREAKGYMTDYATATKAGDLGGRADALVKSMALQRKARSDLAKSVALSSGLDPLTRMTGDAYDGYFMPEGEARSRARAKVDDPLKYAQDMALLTAPALLAGGIGVGVGSKSAPWTGLAALTGASGPAGRIKGKGMADILSSLGKNDAAMAQQTESAAASKHAFDLMDDARQGEIGRRKIATTSQLSEEQQKLDKQQQLATLQKLLAEEDGKRALQSATQTREASDARFRSAMDAHAQLGKYTDDELAAFRKVRATQAEKDIEILPGPQILPPEPIGQPAVLPGNTSGMDIEQLLNHALAEWKMNKGRLSGPTSRAMAKAKARDPKTFQSVSKKLPPLYGVGAGTGAGLLGAFGDTGNADASEPAGGASYLAQLLSAKPSEAANGPTRANLLALLRDNR
jgi:hypothetical protein